MAWGVGASEDLAPEVAPQQPRASKSKELLFIDLPPSGRDLLLAGLRPGIEVIILDAVTPALTQIAGALRARRGVSAVPVVAHGRAGEITFAPGLFSLETLSDHQVALAGLGQALGPSGSLQLWS